MSNLDIFLMILLLVGGVNGFRLGLVQSLANLLGWFFAFFFAVKYYPTWATLFDWTSSEQWVHQVWAFIFIVCGMLILTWISAVILKKALKTLKLSPLDRIIGGAFGGLKSLIFILIVMHIISPWAGQSDIWRNSKMINFLAPHTPIAMKWSQYVKEQAVDYIEEESLKKEQATGSKSKDSSK